MALELDLEQAAVEFAIEWGWLTRKLQWQGSRGAPDRIFFGHGFCVLVEFKMKGNKPKGLQAREIARIKSAYPHMWVIDDLRTFKNKIIGLTACARC